MRVFLATLVVSLAFTAAGCFDVSWGDREPLEGSGTAGSRTVEADGVREVHLAAPGTLVLEPGGGPLVIEGDDNIVERLAVEVEGGELSIAQPRGVTLRPDRPLRYRVGVGRLESVEIAGTGRVEGTGLEADDLEVEIAGSGAVDLGDLQASEVSVSMAGSGDVRLSGKAARLEVEIAGAGDVDAAGLASDEAEVEIAGAGDVTLRAARSLDVQIMGAGDVRYFGSPSVSRRVMGAGDVSRVGD